MTDRYRTLTVVLDDDYREDDVRVFVDALKMLKGVSDVKLGEVVATPEILARMAVASDVKMRLYEAIDSVFRQNEVRKKARGG